MGVGMMDYWIGFGCSEFFMQCFEFGGFLFGLYVFCEFLLCQSCVGIEFDVYFGWGFVCFCEDVQCLIQLYGVVFGCVVLELFVLGRQQVQYLEEYSDEDDYFFVQYWFVYIDNVKGCRGVWLCRVMCVVVSFFGFDW